MTPVNDLLWHVYRQVLPAAFSLLPGQMHSREAVAMMLAIGLQESAFNARRQGGHGTTPGLGPARGYWQFEKNGGVAEILTSPDTKPIITPICELLLYEPVSLVCHEALQHNDTLAACFARLLLWRDPRAMPSPIESVKGWQIYLRNWRPGKPHQATWREHFDAAWAVVKA